MVVMVRFRAVAILAAAAMGYEILLLRLFSIVQWHHFAFMIMSLALLGFGASGTFLALTHQRLLPHFTAVFMSAAVLFGLSAVGSFVVAQQVPFNPLEVAWDPHQWGYLLGLYVLCAVPFFWAALGIGLTLVRFREHIGRIYRADLLGAGVGASGMLLALFVFPPMVCLVLLGTLGFWVAALASLDWLGSRRWWLPLVLLCCGLILPNLWPQRWVQLRLSPYKGLSQTLRLPDASVVSERSSPLGLLAVVRSPMIPLRHAPGLSLNSPVEPPAQLGLFTDGDALSAITHYDGRHEPLAYLDFLTAALPYHLLERPRVLILGAGGGSDVLLASYHQARRIDAVELNPQVVQLVQRTHADFAGRIYSAPNVHLHIAEARGFMATSRERYDLIHVALLDSSQAATAGVHALHQNDLYTVEGLQASLARLHPGGLLAITRWLKLPPRDSLKLFVTALTALERSGVRHAARQIALIRSWQTTTLVVKHGALTPADIAAIETFCAARSFDVAYYPGMSASAANRYNVLDTPLFFTAAVALTQNHRAAFVHRYPYYIAPATDDRPYFFHFFTWHTLPQFLTLSGHRAGLLEWGYLLILMTLLQAAVVGFVLIVIPLRKLRQSPSQRWLRSRIGSYFAALGLAFLGIEIAFIQRLTLFLSHPLYAMAIVLSGFLVFAGLGSGAAARWQQYWQPRGRQHLGKPMVLAVSGIISLAFLYLACLDPLLQWGLSLPTVARMALVLGLIAPLAFCMGLPLPLGLARVAQHTPALIPWVWGVNGCASVVSPILATLISIHWGFTAVIALAAGLYVLAAIILSRPLAGEWL